MENAAKKYNIEPVFQEYGTVESEQDGLYSIRTDSGVWKARQAISCLIKPMTGDLVLLAVNTDNKFFILAILEREQPSLYQLTFDNSVEIKLQSGSLALAAQDGLTLATAGNMHLVSNSLQVQAENGEISLTSLLLSGGFLQIQWNRIKILAEICDSVMERISQRVKRSFRTVEEIDHVKAERLDYSAKGLLSLQGKYSVITAEKDVKIDGEHIHMG